MEAIFCINKSEWDNFLVQNSDMFLQAFEWGKLQEESGLKVFRISIKEGDETLAQAQITKESSFSKNYFYIAYGPVFKIGIDSHLKEDSLKILLQKIQDLAVKENCIFLRIESAVPLCKTDGYTLKIPPRRTQPQKTLILDLTKQEEDLSKEFSTTTRRNINLARKHGVTIKKLNIYSSDFYNLLKKTKNRQEFGVYSENHYKRLFQINGERVKVELFLAEYQGKTVNSTIVVFFNNKATTLHSGSDYNFRKFKAANLLKWEIILSAKKDGFKRLDFWGIDEEKWPNLTSFKKGFGGEELIYPSGIDVVFQKFWYATYKISKIIKIK